MTNKLRKLCSIFALAFFCGSAFGQNSVPAAQRTKACDNEIALAAAEEILKSPNSLKERLHLIYAAGVLFDQGRKDEAVFWDWVARLRGWYDFAISNESLLTNIRRRTAGPITNYALQDIRRFEGILARVQAWDSEIADPVEKKVQVYRHLDDLRARIAAQREEIEQQARAVASDLEQERASMRARTCLKVLIHPSEAPRVIAVEIRQVVEYVKNQPEVVRAVGHLQGASVATFTVEQDHLLPSQYEVNVKGDQLVFAIVDVVRESSSVEFKLACVTRTSFVHRDPFRNPCK
ncbi:MAG: hypothetical protein K2X06_12280 [Burkholderiales bacterium]|nr:hypothetical protein [Burkholderiales bacterium]